VDGKPHHPIAIRAQQLPVPPSTPHVALVAQLLNQITPKMRMEGPFQKYNRLKKDK
jgi:hypothetical protein